MTRARLKFIVGVAAVIAAPVLTALMLFVPVTGAARDAAVALLTLAWTQAATVLRSLFPGPEIDVQPPPRGEPVE